MVGRDIVAVTEARHWYDDTRGGDEESLIHFWLHSRGNAPLEVHGRGDDIFLEFSEPYAGYDMGEFGQTRVEPAAAPDLLAHLPGHRLLDAALIYNKMAVASVSGILLRFDHDDLAIASVGDEWVLRRKTIAPEFAPYLTTGDWLRQSPGTAG